MKTIRLKPVQHSAKRAGVLGDLEPNIEGDTLLVDESDNVIGFYIESPPERIVQLADIANSELRSERVPKSFMDRKRRRPDGSYVVIRQYSAILGSVPPKPHMRRNYATRSSVHATRSSDTFAKAMNAAGRQVLQIIKDVDVGLYETHRAAVLERVPERWRWSELFTSSIANCNISVSLHRDNLNVKGTVNAIICKRRNATGGYLHVPDYGATFGQPDGSLLVYPAWRNMHGVTPIRETHKGGYRNSLIWYALDAFGSAP